MDEYREDRAVERAASIAEVEARLEKVLETVVSQISENQSAGLSPNLTRDDYLASFNSRSLLEFVMSVENEFELELEDEALSNSAQYNFDAWVQYIKGRISRG